MVTICHQKKEMIVRDVGCCRAVGKKRETEQHELGVGESEFHWLEIGRLDIVIEFMCSKTNKTISGSLVKNKQKDRYTVLCAALFPSNTS